MNTDRVATLLSTGLKPSQVATIVGVSPARISQLLTDENFSLLLASKTAEQEKEDIEEASITAKYVAAEHALINQVMEMAPVSELRDVTAALRVVSERQEKMKARTNPIAAAQIVNQTIVSVSLPSHAIPGQAIQMTSNKEVISIGEKTLAPMPSQAVTNLFSSLKEGNKNEQSPSIAKAEESSPDSVPCEEVGFLAFAGTSA